MEVGEVDFVAQLLQKLSVQSPWVPPKTWESIPSVSGKVASGTATAQPRASAFLEFVDSSRDPLVVSETVLVRLVLNALQGVKSAIEEIQKASSMFSLSLADRKFHHNCNLWDRSSSMPSLGRLLKSIGYSGLAFFLLSKFVNYFLGFEVDEGSGCSEDSLKDKISEKPPFTLVNQAFAVAVRKILDGYISALNTVFASVEFRRKRVDKHKNISRRSESFRSDFSEITLLEVYLHTRELRTRIEMLGHICGIKIGDLVFAEFSTKEFSSRMNSEYNSFPRGAELLTHLYVQIRDSDPAHLPLLKFLFLHAYKPYSLFIQSWIFKGRINDPYEEFFVQHPDKATNVCDTPRYFIKEREHTPVPCFLKHVRTPLLRAGQQLLVLMKLQDLYDSSVIREDRVYHGNLCCEVTTLEDVLPRWMNSSNDSDSCFSKLTFSNKDAETMLQKREIMYRVLYEKLQFYFEKLNIGVQPVKEAVIPYGDILFYSDVGDQTHSQVPVALPENLPSSPSSTDGVFSRDVDLSDTDSSCMSADSLPKLNLKEPSEDLTFTITESNSEFKFNFLRRIPVELKNFPDLVPLACDGIEQAHRPPSPSRELQDLVFSSASKPKYFVEKSIASDENDTVSLQGSVNPEMSSYRLKSSTPKWNEDSPIRRLWLPRRLPLNPISANQGDDITSPESHQIENLTISRVVTLEKLHCDQSTKEVPFYDGGMPSTKEFVSQPWTGEFNHDLNRNPVLAKLPWLNSLMHSQRSLLTYFDFSLPEDPTQAFSRRLTSQSCHAKESGALRDHHHHHLTTDPDSNCTDRHVSNGVFVRQENESGFDSSAAVSCHSSATQFVGDLSKNVSGGAGWEGSMMRSSVDVWSDPGALGCSPMGSSDLPIDVVIDKCIVQGIVNQYAYISNFTIKLLEEGFDLHEHLSALRRYYFMELADWADSFLVSLWNHNWSASDPGNLPAEIQGFLMVALQRSSCESDPYHERLYIYEKAQSAGPLSFAAIGTFGLVGLGYKVDWPISIIVTQDALKAYSEIFSFLLEVRLGVFSLSSMWHSLKALNRSSVSRQYLGGQESGSLKIFLRIRQRINHFVSSLQQYLQSQLSDVSWCGFLLSLRQQVDDMLDLESVHMSYLADARNICFLSAGAEEISKIIKNILLCALNLRACLDGSPPEVNLPKALAVQSAFEKSLRELYLNYLRSPKHSEFGLCRFWSVLDYNGFYSNHISIRL